MNLVGHLVDFLWHGLSFWWVAIIDELRKKHAGGPKLIHPTPAPQDDTDASTYELEGDDNDEEEGALIPPFDEYVYYIGDFEPSLNTHPPTAELPDCLASTGCLSTDDLHPDEKKLAYHYGLMLGERWPTAYNSSGSYGHISCGKPWLLMNDPLTWCFAVIFIGAYLLAPFFNQADIMGPIGADDLSMDDSVDTSVDDGDDDNSGDENDNSTDAPASTVTPRKQIELSALPSLSLSVVQEPTVLKYNGIPLHPIQPLASSSSSDAENVDLINRSHVLKSSPSLAALDPSQFPQYPQENPPSSAESSPGNLSRLSDELEQVIQEYCPSSPIILDDHPESISMTLDSANDLAMEAITQRVNTGYNGQFGDLDEGNEVKLLIKIAKVPKSRDLNVTAGTVTRKRPMSATNAIRTSDLLQCPTDLFSINSNLTSGLQSCATGYSTSSLLTCQTDYSNLQTCEPEESNDQSSFQAIPLYFDMQHSAEDNSTTAEDDTPVYDLDPLKAIDNDSEWSNSGTLKNSNSANTQSTTPTPTVPDLENTQEAVDARMDHISSDTSPYSFNRTYSTAPPFTSSSRIPVISSPTQAHISRVFKSSPIPSLKSMKDKPSYKISQAVESHFFNINGQSTDGEEYLCDLFGSDPEVHYDDKRIEALTPSEIDELLSVFVGKETSQNWAVRYENLDVMIGHLRLHQPEQFYDYFQEKITQNLEDILLLVNTTRSKLIVKIVIFIRDLVFFGSDVALSNENFAILTHLLIPLTRSSQASRHIQNLTIKSLCLMLQAITTRSLLANFDLIFKCILCEKKMKGEKYACLMMLKFYILYNKEKLTTMEIRQIADKLSPLVDELSVDAYQKTRMEVVEIYLILLRLLDESDWVSVLARYHDGLGSFLKSQVPLP